MTAWDFPRPPRIVDDALGYDVRRVPVSTNGQATDPDAAWAEKLRTGGSFVFDRPTDEAPRWGTPGGALWPRGEPLVICAPTGVGKTTLAVALTEGLLGLRADVLGVPVLPVDHRVLYVAADRPRQIAKAMARRLRPADRPDIDERLVVWEGLLPHDLVAHPDTLVRLAAAAHADVVIVDSLKDVVSRLSEEAGGHAWARAMQHLCTEGIDAAGTHHQRKAGSDGTKPKHIDDVYGSTWITASAGSVLLIWGQPGDPIVDVSQLKQADGEVGPWRVEVDHATGEMAVCGDTDPLAIMVRGPVTARDLAVALYGRPDPTQSDLKRVERRLDKLVASGLVVVVQASRRGGRGGTVPALYGLADHLPGVGR